MEAWQLRVIQERDELDARVRKLEAFLGGSTGMAISTEDRGILLNQRAAMREYLRMLNLRIAKWAISLQGV